MIEIDDAGSGSLIGGTGIGVFRKETGEYIFKIIPRLYFGSPYFQDKRYQLYVIKIVRLAIKRLGISKEEPIVVCQGYIFDALRAWLAQEGYNWSSARINGALQEKVEASFNDYVIGLGLPPNFVKHARYAFGFHRLLKWVFADIESRAALCKCGWKSWRKWSRAVLKVFPSRAEQDTFCLQCGLLIKKNSDLAVIQYETNRTWQVYVHSACCKYSFTS